VEVSEEWGDLGGELEAREQKRQGCPRREKGFVWNGRGGISAWRWRQGRCSGEKMLVRSWRSPVLPWKRGVGGLGAAKRAVGPEPIQILKHEKMCFSYLKFEISAE
jgi:hypothetical protein